MLLHTVVCTLFFILTELNLHKVLFSCEGRWTLFMNVYKAQIYSYTVRDNRKK